ncbi:hypothetical protein PHYPO_G00208120 [Pangasianodon hypophthalmus]|uniref:Uncharacterized protein n=1 Tax=Pangasianodon hypophthalmus TaxID=310915 RepID=A0A5N5PDY4_PANHP|nr:hypothetical protein PHYPO_G00208120 [Pangasianodon hypophthalmus]
MANLLLCFGLALLSQPRPCTDPALWRKRGEASRDLFRQNPVWRNLSAGESFRSDGNLSTSLWRVAEKRLPWEETRE